MQGEMPLFESILCIQEASYVTENGWILFKVVKQYKQ